VSQSTYEIPGSFDELFRNGDASYKIVDYGKDMAMDNIQALQYFLDQVGVPAEYIIGNWDTQVKIYNPSCNHQIYIDSYGGGDFFRHTYDVSLDEDTPFDPF
jgi:hypothetical protein